MGRSTRRAALGIGRVTLGIALLVASAGAVRFTFLRPPHPAFHNYGVVRTSIGVADVACGGEASDGCGVDTAIRFASCSSQFREYFGFDSSGYASEDLQVRTLIGKRPPSGNRWIAECGSAGDMIQAQPLAKLESN